MSAVRIPVPIGHAAHWKVTEEGKVEVEMLRFLTPAAAKFRHDRSDQRKATA